MSVQARTTQLREHNAFFDDFPAQPAIFFERQVGDEMRIDSFVGGAGSFGTGNCFIVFKKEFIHGKTVKIQWNGFDNTPLGRWPYHIEIMDGAYSRASMTDFPPEFPRIDKGAGRLYFHEKEAENGAWGDEIHEFTADTSGATEEYVTLFICLYDAWIEDVMYLDLDYIRLYDGTTLIFENIFDDEPDMEVEGTFNDYGTVGGVYRPEIFHVDALHLQSSIQSPTDAGGYWICGHYLRKVRAKLDKTLASDHNIPRLILKKARDNLGEVFG